MTTFDLDLSKYKLGWSDASRLRLQAGEGPQPGRRRPDLVVEGRADVDAQAPPAQPAHLRAQADGRRGSRSTCPTSTSTTSTTTSSPTDRSGRRVGRPARADEGHLREARHPRGRAQVPRRRHRAVRVRGRVPPQPRGPRAAGRSSSATWTPRCASTPSSSSSTSARSSRPATTSSPRSTRRCGRGGSFIYVPPGVEVEMPLQAYFRINAENTGQFERTLIIADEGSQGALHRGLLGAGVHHRLAALGRRRDRRQAVAPGSPTRRSRTGRPTSTTSSPSGPGSRPRATWSGSTATSARASR